MNDSAGGRMLPPDVSEEQRRGFLEAAHAVVDEARALVLRSMAEGFHVRTKPDRTLVTSVDTHSEQLMRAGLAERFPEHGIVGEELPPVRPDADLRWILDPLDGTLSFVRGIPLFGIILALHWRETPLLGIIDHPALGLRYSAAVGLGAYCNERRLRIPDLGPEDDIDAEILACGDRGHFAISGKGPAFDVLMRTHPQVRSYADCFGHTLAAAGSVGATVDFGLKLWDWAATPVLIEEAGGKFVCTQQLRKPGQDTLYGMVFGKPRVVDALLPLFG